MVIFDLHYQNNTACRPKLSELQRYVKPFAASQWEELGIALGLADEDNGQLLSEIESKKGENEGKCFMEVVTVWLKKTGKSPKTWETLLQCLAEIEMHDAVRSIQENILKGKLSYLISHMFTVACLLSIVS